VQPSGRTFRAAAIAAGKQKGVLARPGRLSNSEIQLFRLRSDGLGLFRRQDADVASVLALILKQHHAANQREERVVLAASHIQTPAYGECRAGESKSFPHGLLLRRSA